MKNIIITLFTMALLSGFYSCRQQPDKKDRDQDEVSENAVASPDKVELSAEQVKNAGITLGQLVKKQMQKEIAVNGTLRLLPNYQASVSPYAHGYVEKINCQEGSHVEKGDTLAGLKHPDYIRLQQDFLEANGRFTYLKEELDRQKVLSEANVSARKVYQQTQSEYEAARANYFAGKEKLKFLGISPEEVQGGHIQNTIYLKATISGTISQINIHRGELIEPQKVAFEITDNSRLYARLTVFEKDINQIRTGENFIFSVPAFGDSSTYHGKISGIDRVLDLETKTMQATGKIEDSGELVPGQYIEAHVQSHREEVFALPEGAVVQDQNAEYVFVYQGKQKEKSGEESSLFRKIRVITGIKQDGFIQVSNPDPLMNSRNIVLSGAFFLKAEMDKGEGDQD